VGPPPPAVGQDDRLLAQRAPNLVDDRLAVQHPMRRLNHAVVGGDHEERLLVDAGFLIGSQQTTKRLVEGPEKDALIALPLE